MKERRHRESDSNPAKLTERGKQKGREMWVNYLIQRWEFALPRKYLQCSMGNWGVGWGETISGFAPVCYASQHLRAE